MESPNSLYNNINNTSKDGFETENIVIPSNFLISTKEIIARFPHNKRVGHYLLGRKLGEGSFAKVKEGLHTLTGQKVAIKVIDKKKAKEDAYVSKNMRREGKLLQMIIHPNIIQLYELMETENSYYLVTELCEGGDLMDYICARKYLSEACTRKFIRQIISAVDYLHRIGILHRDLKIENLLLDKNLNIKLIDFGLSNYTKSELCITQCGSPAYAAPELLAHKKYGSKVDVWSIGVNMYAMLTGNLPFTVEPFNIKSLYNKMMKNEMNPIPEHLSKSGEDLLRKLLNPDPVKRISLKEAMEHPWINEGYANLLKPFPYPNKPTEDQVNPTILRYMNSNMEFSLNEVAENIKTNKPSSSLATYYLLLNKVKTMLMKIDPKKDKLKPRTDTKPVPVKEIKPTKPITQAPLQPIQQQQPPQTLPSIPNAQSPLPRTVKTPGATNVSVSTTITNTNTFAVVRNSTQQPLTTNKPDAVTKYSTKPSDRTLSPMPIMTNTITTSPTNIGHSNTISGNNAASTFAGAIKSLTQKYKTMHLSSSIDTQIPTNNTSNSNNNFHYKTAYLNGHNLNNSINDQMLNTIINTNTSNNNNNNNSSSSGEGTSSNNSDSISSNEDTKPTTTAQPPHTPQQIPTTKTLTSRNSATPTLGKMSNGTVVNNPNTTTAITSSTTNAEWTQMMKLNPPSSASNSKPIKSDLNNNDMNLSNNHHYNNTNQSVSPNTTLNNEASSIIHLTHNNNSNNATTTTTTNTNTSHMPVISFPSSNNNNSTSLSVNGNSTNASNGTNNSAGFIPSRSAKSPIMKKISSPITLPAIDAGRSTPQ